jgi:hypothetical protein
VGVINSMDDAMMRLTSIQAYKQSKSGDTAAQHCRLGRVGVALPEAPCLLWWLQLLQDHTTVVGMTARWWVLDLSNNRMAETLPRDELMQGCRAGE